MKNYLYFCKIIFGIMKHKNSVSDFIAQRNREFMRAFRIVVAQQQRFDIRKDFELVVEMPCSRFWVSEERATAIIIAMMQKKDILKMMHFSKKEMYMEIFRRVVALKEQHPEMKLYDLVFEVVNSPAPKFYYSPRYARDIYYDIRKSGKDV